MHSVHSNRNAALHAGARNRTTLSPCASTDDAVNKAVWYDATALCTWSFIEGNAQVETFENR
jgi:hypothetical protein